MALSQADIEVIKSAVPPQFRPGADHARLLGNSFSDATDTNVSVAPASGGANFLTDDRTRELAGQMFANNPEAATGFMLTGAQITQQQRDERQRQAKRSSDQFVQNEIEAALHRRLAELDAEIARIDKRLGEITLRRGKIADKLDAIDDINTLLASGQLDPSNPVHAALLRRAGYDADDTKREDFADRVKKDRGDLTREDTALEGETGGLLKRRKEADDQRSELRTARTDVANADSEEAKLSALQRAEAVLGKQTIDTTEKAVSGETADTPGAKEFYAQSDEVEWDAPPPAEPPSV